MVAEYSKFLGPFVLILFVVGLFFIKQPRIQVEEIGRRPWWVGVIRETGQPDCVKLAPADSGYDHCLLDPDQALALAELLDSAAQHCDAKTTKGRPHGV